METPRHQQSGKEYCTKTFTWKYCRSFLEPGFGSTSLASQFTCTPSPSVSWNRHGVKTLINIRNDAYCWFVMKLDRFIGSVSTKYTCVHLLFQWMIYERACDRSGWICIISPIYYRFWNWQKFTCTNSGSLLNKLENWMYGHQVVQFYSVVSR